MAGQGARAAAIEARGNANDAYLSSRIGDYDDFSILMLNSIRNLKAQSGELAKTVRDPQIAPGISQLENISAQAKNYSDSGRYHSALSMRAPFGELSNSTSGAISADGAKYSSLKNALGGFSGKVDSSEWLIGNASASAYQKNLSALEAAYAPPLTLNQMASESAALSSLENALDAELAAKAVSAGNSSSQPKPSSGLPCLPALIPPALLLIAFAHAGWRRL